MAKVIEQIVRITTDGEETRAEVVGEIVRCKDCIHFMPLSEFSLCVAHGSDAVDADDFCSWGERREDAEIHQ